MKKTLGQQIIEELKITKGIKESHIKLDQKHRSVSIWLNDDNYFKFVRWLNENERSNRTSEIHS